jgi:hypothetical protein
MGGYVPYEERLRQERARAAAKAAAEAKAHAAASEQVGSLLDRLGGRGTDCYLEILVPLQGRARRFFNKKTVVRKTLSSGEPDFVIDEVLNAYRIEGALVSMTPDGDTEAFNAYVAPDGRVWRHLGQGVAPDTYQFLASSARDFSNLSTDDLTRIAAGLPR